MGNTIQYNTIQYNTIQYNTIQYNNTLPISITPKWNCSQGSARSKDWGSTRCMPRKLHPVVVVMTCLSIANNLRLVHLIRDGGLAWNQDIVREPEVHAVRFPPTVVFKLCVGKIQNPTAYMGVVPVLVPISPSLVHVPPWHRPHHVTMAKYSRREVEENGNHYCS